MRWLKRDKFSSLNVLNWCVSIGGYLVWVSEIQDILENNKINIHKPNQD